MGRTLKRVPLDFEWPLNQVWKGYFNPYHSQQCKSCESSGLNPKTKKLSDDWYTHLRTDGKEGWGEHLDQEDVNSLVEKGRLRDFTHNWTPEEGWKKKNPPYIPTAEEVNRWSKKGFGHDSINHWICVEARAKRFGFYGKCKFCDGEGEIWQNKEIKELHDKWESFEPPTGEGFQLWETTSEGSPISPVFETLDDLCSWAEKNQTTFGSHKTSKEEWEKMLNDDFVVYKEGNLIFM